MKKVEVAMATISATSQVRAAARALGIKKVVYQDLPGGLAALLDGRGHVALIDRKLTTAQKVIAIQGLGRSNNWPLLSMKRASVIKRESHLQRQHVGAK